MPAAAVIPAPIAYIKVVAVKKKFNIYIFISNLKELYSYKYYCLINIYNNYIVMKRYSFLNISSFLRKEFNSL
ncbi:hypothetical protein FO675_11000 [Riemerella anatipestifer]|nr:hypothetical protein [Riemerella anatipestifer]